MSFKNGMNMSSRTGKALALIAGCLLPVKAESLDLQVNHEARFEAPAPKRYQPGPIEGTAAVNGIAIRQPIRALTLTNIGGNAGDTLAISAIALNGTAMVFDRAGFDLVYPPVSTQLDQVQRFFWEHARRVHHANLPNAMAEQNIFSLWNGSGFGICTVQATAAARFLAVKGFDIRPALIKYHQLYEVKVDGRWQLYDFDKQAYYLGQSGLPASQEALRFDPYPVFSQQTGGPLASKFDRYNTAVLMNQKVTPFQRINYRLGSWQAFLPKAHPAGQPLTIRSRDKIIFTNAPTKTAAAQYVDSLWQGAGAFYHEGEYHLSHQDATRKVEVSLPFWVDRIDLSFTASGGMVYTVLFNGQPILRRKADGGRVALDSRILDVSSKGLGLEFIPETRGESFKASGIRLIAHFAYNSRALQSVEEKNRLLVAGDGGKLEVQAEFDPGYENPLGPVGFAVKQTKRGIAVEAPAYAGQMAECFVSSPGSSYPAAPAVHAIFHDLPGQIETTLLPTGAYDLHCRQYSDGYFSPWEILAGAVTAKGSELVPRPIFEHKNDALTALLPKDTDEPCTMIVSDQRQFPVWHDQPYFSPSKNPELDGLAKTPGHRYDRITLIPGIPSPVPTWAHFARVVNGGQPGPLLSVFNELKENGYQPSRILTDLPRDLMIQVDSPYGPAEHHWWKLD